MLVANRRGGHELAHLAGFALESDADVASAIAGLRAGNPFARYATALRWWSKLPSPPVAAGPSLLPRRARDDLEALARALKAHQAPAFMQDVQRSSYDTYLKTQRVPDGIENYDAAVAYLVSALEKGLL